MDKKSKEIDKKLRKRNRLLRRGLINGKIRPYPKEYFERLRPYQIGGFPVSLMLLITELNNGHCYDRARLMQIPLKDCKVVHATIESLRRPYGEEHAEHAYIVTTDFGGEKVIDTSMCLIYDKAYYDKMEKPKVNSVFTKEECMSYLDVQEIIAGDFEKDKYALPIYLPFIENAVAQSEWLGTRLYKKFILEELEKFKKAIKYDELVAEIDDDIKLMKREPKKMDEKFGIIRDQYGREISRNGVPNPYYVSPEQLIADEEYFQSIKDDEEKMNEYLSKLTEASNRARIEEWTATALRAEARLAEIDKNPTANFYENE